MGPASRFEDLSSKGPPGNVEAVCNAIPKIPHSSNLSETPGTCLLFDRKGLGESGS